MPARPHAISDSEFERFRALVLERSGLHFPDKRRADLERGLVQALGRAQCRDLDEYYRLLSGSPTDGPEWEQLIGQVTVGETYFFRDQPQFEALRSRLLPDLITEKRALNRQLRIWSAGCASGEEPYSIAMLLRELIPDLSAWSITILASDINREALAKARAGHYGDWSFREEGWMGMRDRYFIRRGKEWELADSIKQMVSFTYLNLVEDAYPALANNTVAFDLIICRNVTIYFTPELTRRVVGHLYEALSEGGWLVVGHSEPSPVTYNRFHAHTFPGTILYQKSGQAPAVDLSWLTALERAPAKPLARVTPPPLLPPVVPPPPPRGRPTPAPVAEPAPPTTAERCAQVTALLERGEVETALEMLHGMLKENPRCARAYYMVGKIRANAGRWEEARHWCEQALAQDPLLVEGHLLLSLVCSQEGKTEEALAAMKRVVYLDRNAILGHFCLGNLYRELGNEARARKSLENALQLLNQLPDGVEVPWSDGMTAGRLRFIVRRQLNGDNRASRAGALGKSSRS